LGRFGFYAVFACAVTASVQLVGVYLVFASLIVPALATRHYPPRWRMPLAYSLGGISYALGLLLSAWSDLPSGAVIVWMLAGFGVLGSWVGPKSGDPLLSEQGKAA
jgi:zinc/manganese transport system permease protein